MADWFRNPTFDAAAKLERQRRVGLWSHQDKGRLVN